MASDNGGNFITNADSFLNGGLVGDFVDHKAANFAANREGYFHYVIQAFAFGEGGVASGAGGRGYAPGFDFIVTRGLLRLLSMRVFSRQFCRR